MLKSYADNQPRHKADPSPRQSLPGFQSAVSFLLYMAWYLQEGFHAKATTMACTSILPLSFEGSLCLSSYLNSINPTVQFFWWLPLLTVDPSLSIFLPHTVLPHLPFMFPFLPPRACCTTPQNGTGKLSSLSLVFTKALKVCFRNFQKYRKSQQRK